MPDICDLVLEQHENLRRRFAELDELRKGGDAAALARLWEPLAALLELHASAEEEVFYPHLLKKGDNAEDETEDAIEDHNKIRDAVKAAAKQETGTDAWWGAVLEAREENSDHIAEEEREALPDFRVNADETLRNELGTQWVAYHQEHAGGRGLDHEDKDPDDYLSQNT